MLLSVPPAALAERDPAAAGRLGWSLLALGIGWLLAHGAGVDPKALFDAGNLRLIGGFLAAFLPPETGREFLGYLAQATLETLAIATAGMAIAIVLAVPLAYLASSAGRERRTLNPWSRSLLTVLRGIPELVWALVFVRVFGLGPAAGVLALGLTYGGMLAKVYAEILESVPPAPAVALCQSGAGRPLALASPLLASRSKYLRPARCKHSTLYFHCLQPLSAIKQRERVRGGQWGAERKRVPMRGRRRLRARLRASRMLSSANCCGAA